MRPPSSPRPGASRGLVLAFAVLAFGACAGQGSGSGCGALTPIPGGFAGPKTNNAVNLRLTAQGINTLNTNWRKLVETFAPGGRLEIPISCAMKPGKADSFLHFADQGTPGCTSTSCGRGDGVCDHRSLEREVRRADHAHRRHHRLRPAPARAGPGRGERQPRARHRRHHRRRRLRLLLGALQRDRERADAEHLPRAGEAARRHPLGPDPLDRHPRARRDADLRRGRLAAAAALPRRERPRRSTSWAAGSAPTPRAPRSTGSATRCSRCSRRSSTT